jgi:hypothetical protein
MSKFIITVIGEAEEAPCASGIKSAIERWNNQAKVTFIAAGDEYQIEYWTSHQSSYEPPRRTLWADLPTEAQSQFRQLAEDFDTAIPMWEDSVETAIAKLPDGPLRRQAQRIYDNYVK